MAAPSLWLRMRKLVYGALIGLLASGAVLVWRYANLPFSYMATGLELWTYDYRTTWRAGELDETREQPCAIVAIDQQSVDAFEMDGIGWPWPRSLHGQLVRRLKAAGAAVIAFDVTFDTVRTAPGWEPDPDDILADPEPCDEDKEFAEAVAEAGNVVLSVLIGEPKEDPTDPEAPPMQDATYPAWLFENAAAAVGDVNVPVDQDGTVRRAWLFRQFREERVPGLAVSAAALSRGQAPDDYLVGLQAGLTDVLQKDGTLWLDYHGGPRSVPTLSFYDVWSGRVDPGLIAGKIVLIGATAVDLQDLYPVPVISGEEWTVSREPMPGVEIHANVVRTLLSQGGLRLAPVWVTLLMTLLVGALTGVVTLYVRPLPSLLTYVPLTFLVITGVGFVVFAKQGVWFNITLPLLGAWGSSYVASTVFAYFTVERERKRIETAWGKRVSPEVLKMILANPSLQYVQGRTIQATVLFSDLRGFTTLCHSWHPEEVVRRLNEIFDRMSPIVQKHGGNIDKYIGDGIMAVFGDPIPQEDHARRAALAAIDMLRALEELKAQAEARGDQPINMGVGIHTGELVAGDIGSADRLEYTAIGDTVSTASRLEGLNKEYSTQIIISGDTKEQAGEDIPTRLLDTTTVRGRETPLQVHEVLWAN